MGSFLLHEAKLNVSLQTKENVGIIQSLHLHVNQDESSKKVTGKSPGSATITNHSSFQTPRGRGNRQNQTSANRTNVQKTLRSALSSPSKVIAMLKGLKNTRTEWHKVTEESTNALYRQSRPAFGSHTNYHVCPKYLETLSHYSTYSQIWTSLFD